MASGRFGVISASRIASRRARLDRLDRDARLIEEPPRAVGAARRGDVDEVGEPLERELHCPPRELAQEALVALEEEAQVREAVLQQRHAVDPEAEREARVLLGIDRDALQDARVHHARAHDLDPARALALSAARSLAEDAAHRDVHAGLDEREERRDEPRPRALAEELLEERRTTVPFRSAIEMPWSTTRPSTWWKTGECVASTSSLRYTRPGRPGSAAARRGVRISRICTGDVCVRRSSGDTRLAVEQEGVLRVARRVVGREVQSLEVVEVVLDLRAVGDRIAHAQEDALDAAADDRDRVQPAGRAWRRPGSVDVHRGRAVAGGGLAALELRREPRDAPPRSRAWRRWPVAEGRALGRRQRLQLREERRHAAPSRGRGSGPSGARTRRARTHPARSPRGRSASSSGDADRPSGADKPRRSSAPAWRRRPDA